VGESACLFLNAVQNELARLAGYCAFKPMATRPLLLLRSPASSMNAAGIVSERSSPLALMPWLRAAGLDMRLNDDDAHCPEALANASGPRAPSGTWRLIPQAPRHAR
jgi:hypothetical protein